MGKSLDYDVIVVGAGSAALAAAISARNERASVVVLEKSPRDSMGGNCRFTDGGLRFWHRGRAEIVEFMPDMSEEEAQSIIIPEYAADDWYNKLLQLSEERADPRLAELLVTESNPTVRWLRDQGLQFELAMGTAFRVGDRFTWRPDGIPMHSRGGGQGLLSQLCSIAGQKGIEILYQTKAVKLILDSKAKVSGVTILGKEGFRDIRSKAVVLACGGFESNREWRAKYLGPGWDLVRPRGTKYNTGDGLRMALETGAQPSGHWSGCHAIAIDYDYSRIPEGEDIPLVINRRDCLLGVQVNVNGMRFMDEGKDLRNYMYATVGRQIIQQPQGMAWQIFDGKVTGRLDSDYRNAPSVTANSIEELAGKLRAPALTRTIDEFNAAVREETPLNYDVTDGRGTVGITPPKSNWAQKIDEPPFVAYGVGCGLTFTYGGLKINTEARVLNGEGEVIPGLFATGEIVGFWHNIYTGAGGITLGAVFGRVAGANAAAE
ncbi:MAG: FAD-dependent tricarballylate dehydrogenase TcuA [Chloroflexi bacterium]|nr:FAD-dependent tricarballylate dehydrogenase TcuA [Chloroflexota bacterium]